MRLERLAVWNAIVQPPETIKLSSKTFREFATQSLAQGELLMLPAPAPETLEAALNDGPDADLDAPLNDNEVQMMQQGGPCDVGYWRKRWFATVEGSPLDSDAARAVYISNFTNGAFTSLSQYLSTLTDAGAQEFHNMVIEDAQREWSGPEVYAFLVQQCDHLGITNDGKPWPALKPKAHPDIVEKAIQRVVASLEPAPSEAFQSSASLTDSDVQEGEVVDDGTSEALAELVDYCTKRGFCFTAAGIPDVDTILLSLQQAGFAQVISNDTLTQAKQALERHYINITPNGWTPAQGLKDVQAAYTDDDDSDPFADE